jgi:hypothetical protein
MFAAAVWKYRSKNEKSPARTSWDALEYFGKKPSVGGVA